MEIQSNIEHSNAIFYKAFYVSLHSEETVIYSKIYYQEGFDLVIYDDKSSLFIK